MTEIVTWCVSKRAIFKHLQILCCLIAVLFLIDGRQQWKPYTVIMITDIVLAVIVILTLVLYFVQAQKKNQALWAKIELAFNFLAAIISFVFVGILIYDYVKMDSNQFGHHQFSPPLKIGATGWMNRILIIIVSHIVQAVVFLMSLVWAHKYSV
ncbi:hypothetical protein FO519_006500 [Halicephalobus sp. NKZ332]|nr:hypothetical protein FO519_006500 [Halicephalobus sp. NKZ332]